MLFNLKRAMSIGKTFFFSIAVRKTQPILPVRTQQEHIELDCRKLNSHLLLHFYVCLFRQAILRNNVCRPLLAFLAVV